MLAIAANKDDMYENEEVDENEAKNLASELNAIFQIMVLKIYLKKSEKKF